MGFNVSGPPWVVSLDSWQTAAQALVSGAVNATDDRTVAIDQTAAFEAAMAMAVAVAGSAKWPARHASRPVVRLPPGEFRVTRSITQFAKGMRIVGAGKFATSIYFDNATDTACFEIGPVVTTVTNVFTQANTVSEVEFSDLRIIRQYTGVNTSGTPGARTGHGIRMNGGGTLVLRNVAVQGFKYGVNAVFGGDFNEVHECGFEFCDVGMYLGPGSQQVAMFKPNFYFCVEGLVTERLASASFVMPIFNSCSESGWTIESNAVDTVTRQLTSCPIAGTSLQAAISVVSPWFEGGADAGPTSIPTHFVKCVLNGSDTCRGVTFYDSRIFAFSFTKTTTSLLGSTGTFPPQGFNFNGVTFSGVMTNIFSNPGNGCTVREWVTEAGYTQPTISNLSTAVVRWERTTGATEDMRTGSAIAYSEMASFDQTQGVRQESEWSGGNGIVRWAFRNAGSWLQRFTIDVQNRRLYFGIDGGAPNASIDFGTAAPASGTWGVGSIRWNTNAGTAIPQGWKCTTAGTPGTWTAMPNI